MNKTLSCDIWVKGQLSNAWTTWFEGLTLTADAHHRTRISGLLPDQAALYGLLNRLRDLGLTLLTVQCVEVEETGGPHV
jgi:hypothetical protein